jgi:hypothetical protein
MEKLEKFINDLNRIQNELKSDEARPKQTENDYLDKMAKFLFSADTGWKILTSIYSQKIQVSVLKISMAVFSFLKISSVLNSLVRFIHYLTKNDERLKGLLNFVFSDNLNLYERCYTVKVMILSRYRYRYRPLLTVTDHYRYLRYKRYQRYINFLIKLFKTHYITIGNACNASYGKIR